jgi:hypothetical protein
MARPQKPGLEYFPKDSDMYSDRKIRRLMAKCGLAGVVVYDYLLCLIYGKEGYFLRIDQELAFDIADFIGCSVSEEDVMSIIEACLQFDLFDKDLFEARSVLSSFGIQERYLIAKRNGFIREQYVIADKTRVFTVETQVNAQEFAETPILGAESAPNQAKSTQSKVKEIKGEEIKGKDSVLGATDVANPPPKNLNSEDPLKPPEKKNTPPVPRRPPADASVNKFELNEDERGVVRCTVLQAMIDEYKRQHHGLYTEQMYEEFLTHWSTPLDSGKPKWREQIERKNGAFHIPGRLATWKKNEFNSTLQRGAVPKPHTTAKGNFEYRGGRVLNDVEE